MLLLLMVYHFLDDLLQQRAQIKVQQGILEEKALDMPSNRQHRLHALINLNRLTDQ